MFLASCNEVVALLLVVRTLRTLLESCTEVAALLVVRTLLASCTEVAALLLVVRTSSGLCDLFLEAMAAACDLGEYTGSCGVDENGIVGCCGDTFGPPDVRDPGKGGRNTSLEASAAF